LLTGCASGPSTPSPSAAPAVSSASHVIVSEAWAKSASAADNTAVFGRIASRTGHSLSIVSVESPDAMSAELHTTSMSADGAMNMQQTDALQVPASGALTLEPGGIHVMLMGLHRPVRAGDKVTLTLRLSDGSRTTFTAIAKEYTGAQESYGPTPSSTPAR